MGPCIQGLGISRHLKTNLGVVRGQIVDSKPWAWRWTQLWRRKARDWKVEPLEISGAASLRLYRQGSLSQMDPEGPAF